MTHPMPERWRYGNLGARVRRSRSCAGIYAAFAPPRPLEGALALIADDAELVAARHGGPGWGAPSPTDGHAGVREYFADDGAGLAPSWSCTPTTSAPPAAAWSCSGTSRDGSATSACVVRVVWTWKVRDGKALVGPRQRRGGGGGPVTTEAPGPTAKGSRPSVRCSRARRLLALPGRRALDR